MTTFTQNIVAPAKAGAYLAPQPATTDSIGSSLRWSDGQVSFNKSATLS